MKKKIENLRSGNFIYIIALTFAVVFLFWNIHDIMFTVHDDMRIYTMTKLGRLPEYAVAVAKNGRIAQLWNTILLGIPFLADSVVVYKIFSFASILFDAFAFFILMKNHAGKNIAYISLLLFFSFATLSTYHNLLTAYALCHQIPIGFELLSINFYLNYFEPKANKKLNMILSSIFFLMASMIYEAFAAFIIFYAVIAVIKNFNNKTGKPEIKKVLIDLLLPFIVISAYIAIYFLWRVKYPTQYDGGMLYFNEPFMSLKTIYHYSVSFSSIFQFFNMITQRVFGLGSFLKMLTLGSIFKAMIVSVIFFKAIPKLSVKCNDYVLLLFSLAGMFLPNCIVGFTQKYVDWEKRGAYGYLTSFYSYFFLIVFVVTAIYMIYTRIKNIKGKEVFMCFMTGAVFLSCICADVNTDIWGGHYRQQYLKCRSFDKAVSSEFITNLEDDTDIYIPDNMGINTRMDYTEDYASIYSDNDIHFYNDITEIDFKETTVCMRYKAKYNIMIMAYVDENLYAKTIYVSMPDSKPQNLIMTLENGTDVIYENVKDGDIINYENNILFDLSQNNMD